MNLAIINVLNGYPLWHICKFLDPMDIANMCHVYPNQWRKLYYVFRDCVMNKIDSFFKDYFCDSYDEFVKEMIKNKAVISGSFILQIILGEKWNNSDIDFYIPIKGLTLEKTPFGNIKSSLEEFLYFKAKHLCPNYQSGYETGPRTDIKFIRDYTKMTKEQLDKLESIDPNNYFFEKHIMDRKYDINALRLQAILIDLDTDYDTVKKHIIYNFDLDICKNVFYYESDGRAKLNIFKAYQIIDKKTNFNFNHKVNDPIARYIKYKNRGFQFIENNDEIFKIIIDNATMICYKDGTIHTEYKTKRYRLFEGVQIDKELYYNIHKDKSVIIPNKNKYIFSHVNNFYKITKNISGDEFDGCTCYAGSSILMCFEHCPIAILYGDKKHVHVSQACYQCQQYNHIQNILFIN